MNNLGLLRNFWRSWEQHTTLQITTLAVLTGTFVVITFSILIHHNLDQILSKWGSSMQMSVYLKENIDTDIQTKVIEHLQKELGFEDVSYVSKQAAAKAFAEKLKDVVPDLLQDKEFGNPLPASYEVQLPESYSDPEMITELVGNVAKIKSLEGVDDVLYGKGWVENYAILVSGFKWASWAGIFLLIGGTLLVIGNSIRSSIFQRQEEIAVLELFGATSRMIQIPFVFEGALLGLIATVISLGTCYFFYLGQESVLSGSLAFWGLNSTLSFLPIWKSGLVLFLGVLAGAMGSYFCVHRLNNGWAAADNMGNVRIEA